MSKIEAWIAGDRLTAASVAYPGKCIQYHPSAPTHLSAASGRSADRVSVDCSASRQHEATVGVSQIVQGRARGRRQGPASCDTGITPDKIT
ncbi:uncharacterized protein SCHCODRAFT_02613461 [Schizophyllum commune H4-8]|uniref:uncharacterized protein n=1 Tax=Schizophyllum commune (strain H4-8 / FGSC 9210) TaxID=578458 RepID=UPI00215F8FAD|nr:uncharacterized protein SCHCODRAFT_02613433 [Schizophyllum commune H4-8]XP_050202521.1 uncharacterized protein SCHCODRAFT_02613461 [Schizophyllum commune H4-8]KAI5898880.1 hypothetical protein SCHCODRAFT_02613433 [Schizophyllum commune H4-8]KAI5898887.1 hypothetical protein SCHCODRAFT_02613461 [Schizophyllum commune H4-8]